MRPRRLYRYRPFNRHTERIFTRGEVYVPSPLEFNDPFDCRIPVVPIGSTDDFKRLLDEYWTSKDPNLSTTEREQLVEAKLSEGEHKHVSKMKSAMGEVIENELRAIGVYCLSAKNDDILMWSHYADGHKGFCLEFEDDSPNSFLNRAKKVTYQKELLVLNSFDESWVRKLLATKSDRWSYEEEWRIIEVDGAGIAGLPEGILSGVIFGCQICDKHINKIISWLDRRTKPIRLYRAKMKSDVFGLDIVPINDTMAEK